MRAVTKIVSEYLGRDSGLVVTNPADGSQLGTVRDWTASDTASAVMTASAAMNSWRSRTAKDRASVLMNWHDLILEHQNDLAALTTAECGKPIGESIGEVAYGASFVQWFAEEAKRMYGDVMPSHAANKQIMVMRQAIGVVSAITPWNFPLAMITRKIAPALAAGCTALVKPAEATPLTALALEKLALEAGIPEGVFQVITTTDPASIGKVLTEHPVIKKFSFTGSTAVGKVLAAQCAGTMKKISMELGGNAPFIVFDDADIDAAIEGAMISKYRNTGQTCVCANRFFIHADIHDEFVARLSAAVAALKVGDGSEAGVSIGPLINQVGADKVAGLVDSAISAGARVIIGGKRHSYGDAYYEPTILTDLNHDMEIASREIFGPVAAIYTFQSEAEVIKMANDTPYGLAAYFYSRDLGRCFRMMEALDYGMVGVNEGVMSTEVAPFGGVKESGVGREGSKYGLEEYTELKYCLIGGLT